MMKKTQFNVYLPPRLVKAVKHRAIDEGMSLSALVEQVLSAYVHEDQPADTSRPDDTGSTAGTSPTEEVP